MQINSLIAKTALAAAIAGASFAASAGDLIVPTPSIVATEVFGDAKNTASESNLTAITLPELRFFASVGGDLVTKNAGVGSATIKLSLLGDTLFAENYQDPSLWAAKGIVVEVDGVPIDEKDIASVDAATANDNTLVITLKPGAALTGGAASNLVATTNNLLKTTATPTTPAVSIAGFKVKRLKSALQTPGQANVTIEVRAVENAAAALLAAEAFENTPSVAAIVSTQGVVIAGVATDYTAAPSSTRGYIQVGDAQQSFTDAITPLAGHRDDYDTNVNQLNLGTLSLVRGVVAPLRPGAGSEAGKETGVKFDFTGADTLKLSISGSAPLAGYGLELRTDGSCVNAGTAAGRLSVATVSAVDPTTATFAVNTSDTNLDAPVAWNLCGVANVAGADRIPQLNNLNANFTVDYANIRYGKSEGGFAYGPVLRNGCQVTLFNLPNVTAQDNAMIRFTNTSDRDGQVNAFAYLEDGTLVDASAELQSNLVAHGTTVFHTRSDLTSGVYLGDVMPQFGAETSGRARIVIQGAFPSCEALGMVRSSNGTLVNMTSTTNSDSDTTAVGTFGTSNTSN